MNFIRNHRGMSLVEILVGIVIAGIVMTVVGSIFLAGTNMFTEMATTKEAKSVLDVVYDKLSATLTYATAITITDSSDAPSGWAESNDHWIGFASYGDSGYLETKEAGMVYGETFYENGSIKANISYTNNTKKHLTVSLEFNNKRDEKVYQHERSIDIVNMSKFGINITGATSIQNDTKALYIHYRKEPQGVVSSIDTEEYKLYTALKEMYDATRLKNGADFYKNIGTKINVEGLNTICYHPFAYLGWQYRLETMGASYTQEFMTLSHDRLVEMGVDEVLSYIDLREITQDFLYVVPCHFVQNTEELDLLLYAYGSYFFDNDDTDKKFGHITNLIYIQEENAWYYFKKDTTSGTKGMCSSIKTNNKEYYGFPVIPGNTITYTDSEGTKTVNLTSSFQVKQFFVRYGRKCS